MSEPMKDKMLFYESIAEEWDAKYNQDELGKRMRLVFRDLIHAEDVKGKRVLDAGAGTGHFSRVLAEWGADLTSLDMGEKLMAEIQKKCKTKPVVGSVLELPFPDRSFDAVVCTEVVEHTPDPKKAVQELCRVVAPGGVLALTTPNKVWQPAIAVATALKLRPYLGHENFTWFNDLAAWVPGAGLEIELHAGFNMLPHTIFCKPAFEFIDRIGPLHGCMINIAVRARRPR